MASWGTDILNGTESKRREIKGHEDGEVIGGRSQLLMPCLEFNHGSVFVHDTNESAHFMDETNEPRKGHSWLSQKRTQDYWFLTMSILSATCFLKVSV